MRWWLWLIAVACILVFALATQFRTISSGQPSDALRSWLQLHPPRKARYDATLLRRRRLVSIEALNVTSLKQHVPQLLASLMNSDPTVRQLALRSLSRLGPSDVAAEAELLAEVLGSTTDAAVEGYVLQTLIALTDGVTIASASADIFERLSSDIPSVRSAAVSALGLLDPQDLAPYAAAAVEVLKGRRDKSLLALAISSWSVQLESDGCRERAGESACHGALSALKEGLR